MARQWCLRWPSLAGGGRTWNCRRATTSARLAVLGLGWATHLIFVELLAVNDLWPLDDVFRGDERVVGDRLESQTVVLPRREVIRAVDGDAAAFHLVLGLVFTKPPELALFIDGDAAGMGVYQIAVGVVPSSTGHDVLGLSEAEQKDRETHGCGWRFGTLFRHVIYSAGWIYPERRIGCLST
jgi:hypothetical protein